MTSYLGIFKGQIPESFKGFLNFSDVKFPNFPKVKFLNFRKVINLLRTRALLSSSVSGFFTFSPTAVMPLFRYIFFFKCVYISLLFNLQTPNILDKLVLQLLLKNLHHKLKRFQKITGRSSNSHWETFNKTSLASLEIILRYVFIPPSR